jgi:hypothetical protein
MRAHQLIPRALVVGALLTTASLTTAALAPSNAATHHGHAGDKAEHLTGRQARIQGRLDARLQAPPASWHVSPGVNYREWTTTDADGTPQRIHVLEVNPTKPGVSVDYLANSHLRSTAPVSKILKSDPTMTAGVNASFFDISDTGAPDGVGYNRKRGLLHAPTSGFNNCFYQSPDGSYHVGPLALVAHLNEFPTWPVTGLNIPSVRPGEITVYTPSWGAAAGNSVINSPADSVREVVVQNGVVVSNSPTLSTGTNVTGVMFVGRGSAANLLATLPIGSPLSVSWALDQPVSMAVSGNQVLVSGGTVVAPDDHLTAPRTAVGIRGNGHLLLVTVDGRMESAAGMTLPALGALMTSLGARDALNFDGGGSSTMIARSWNWSRYPQLVNLPSDGSPRHVADSLSVDYTPPVS